MPVYIDRRTDTLGAGKSLRDGANEEFVAVGHALRHDGAVASNEVDTNLSGNAVEGLADLHIVARSLAARTADDGDRSDRDALVDDRDAILAADIFACLHKVACQTCDLIVDILAGLCHIVGGTIQKADTHGDGAHVEILLLDHFIGFDYLAYVDHCINNLLIIYDASCRRYLRAGT